MAAVFLKCQSPTVAIPVIARSPDTEDNLTIVFNRYDTTKAGIKLKEFDDARRVDFADLVSEDSDDAEKKNAKIRKANDTLAEKSDKKVFDILYSEIVDIKGLVDSEGNPVDYAGADAKDRKAIYKMLHTSNPYIVAIVGGYNQSLINIGEARAKN